MRKTTILCSVDTCCMLFSMSYKEISYYLGRKILRRPENCRFLQYWLFHARECRKYCLYAWRFQWNDCIFYWKYGNSELNPRKSNKPGFWLDIWARIIRCWPIFIKMLKKKLYFLKIYFVEKRKAGILNELFKQQQVLLKCIKIIWQLLFLVFFKERFIFYYFLKKLQNFVSISSEIRANPLGLRFLLLWVPNSASKLLKDWLFP